ncbi:MAG TPA: 3-deoxy-manno-octulosonate cytidylyltransferase [Gammaproteobacteria bacterium]
MSADFVAVIPARYASTRLPGKPLKDIGGRTMIERVFRQASLSGAAEVLVATDDERIAAECRRFGARCEMTSPAHASGTDRIAELAHRLGWPDDRIVVNVQGDEPFLPPALVTQTAELLAARPEAHIATLVTRFRDAAELRDPNTAKVVLDRDGFALYFSRSPIPHTADGDHRGAWRHIGLYGYRAAALKRLAAEPPCELERVERLEQLRALWLGMRIVVGEARELPPRHVDTEEDLIYARRYAAQLEVEEGGGGRLR